MQNVIICSKEAPIAFRVAVLFGVGEGWATIQKEPKSVPLPDCSHHEMGPMRATSRKGRLSRVWRTARQTQSKDLRFNYVA